MPEPERTHIFRPVDIPQVDDHGCGHDLLDPPEIERTKLAPLGDDDERVRAAGAGVGVVAIFDAAQLLPRLLPLGKRFSYPSLIDESSAAPNFDQIGRTPTLYLVQGGCEVVTNLALVITRAEIKSPSDCR